MTLGLQDFAGTGIYAGEYIVATKNFDSGAQPSRRGRQAEADRRSGLGTSGVQRLHRQYFRHPAGVCCRRYRGRIGL
nr:YjbH domain-containing protein [Phaeobacter inhibens]